jgi:putative membrane protein
MRTSFLAAIPIAVASFTLAPVSLAQTSATGSDTGSVKAAGEPATSLSAGDRRFIEKVARDSMAEMRMGQLAKNRGLREEVKEFANRMVTDHRAVNDALRSLAAAKGVALPSQIAGKDQRAMDKLGRAVGPDFDRAYMSHVVSNHAKDVTAFRQEAENGKDPDVRDFAASKIATLEDHMRAARVTRDIVQGTK